MRRSIAPVGLSVEVPGCSGKAEVGRLGGPAHGPERRVAARVPVGPDTAASRRRCPPDQPRRESAPFYGADAYSPSSSVSTRCSVSPAR